MKFQLESELVKVLLKGLPGPLTSLARAPRFAIARELPVSSRVLDVAIACFTTDICERLDTFRGLSALRLSEIDTLARILELRPNSLARSLSGSEALCQLVLKLERRGFVERKGGGAVAFTRWTKDLPPKLIAIEAKLSRWEEALEQAKFHAIHSDYSYVALDEFCFQQNPDEIRSGFLTAKIGLLTVSVSGKVRIQIPGSKLRPDKVHNNFQKLRALRDIAVHRGSKYVLTPD